MEELDSWVVLCFALPCMGLSEAMISASRDRLRKDNDIEQLTLLIQRRFKV